MDFSPTQAASWESRFARFLESRSDVDAAHDRAHVERVVAAAKRLAALEEAHWAVVVPAAWLHDCVTVPKDSSRRAEASTLAADVASDFLRDAGYPEATIPAIRHAIAAHSFSAGIAPETVEAKVVQDADRLDALGAVGIARCLMVGGALDRTLYAPDDPFCDTRTPDDGTYTLDHFYAKLLRLPDTMQTDAGRTEAEQRAAFMRTYLDRLRDEITTPRTD